MTSKVYKTAQGKTIDMGQLMLQNEKTRAVGNMNVNARGDLINDRNEVIEPKPAAVKKQYDRTVQQSQRKRP
jgi:hypothetical protein